MRDEWRDAKAMEVQGFADKHEDKEFHAAQLPEVYCSFHSTVVRLKTTDRSALITKNA